jgi:hypothetical protein
VVFHFESLLSLSNLFSSILSGSDEVDLVLPDGSHRIRKKKGRPDENIPVSSKRAKKKGSGKDWDWRWGLYFIKGVCFESCTHYVPLQRDKIPRADQRGTQGLPCHLFSILLQFLPRK